METVVIESPYAGNIEENKKYLNACILDSLKRGEAPYASHYIYTNFLNDEIAEERAQGILAGFKWGEKADLIAVYADKGISTGMAEAIEHYSKLGIEIEIRSISGVEEI